MILLGIATAVQLLVLLGLALVVLSLARQVGILHERLSPAGLVRQQALEPGEVVPASGLTALSGSVVELMGTPAALLFVSTDCPVCRAVLPAFREALEGSSFAGVWVADGLPGADGRQPDYGAYARAQGLDPDRFVVSQALGLKLGIRQIPALALLDGAGRLLGRHSVSGSRELKRLVGDGARQLATPKGENST